MSVTAPKSDLICLPKKLIIESKTYNTENKKLDQTGVEMMYAQLQSDPLKLNIMASIIESLPWWLDLHGFWQTNPSGFNTSPATADPGQDLEVEALTLFCFGYPNSEAVQI
ncbi:hypothetical protein JVU11DRAFT_8775 [Chiua virens]|nr:hypothetical protein JVU11DRAFT_8775 [Chiua virens]